MKIAITCLAATVALAPLTSRAETPFDVCQQLWRMAGFPGDTPGCGVPQGGIMVGPPCPCPSGMLGAPSSDPNGWYVESVDHSKCTPANKETPAWFIQSDAANGLGDRVIRNGDKVTIFEPQPNNMVTVVTYFHGAAACDADAKEHTQQLQDLN